jgi:ABC-type transport system substrate-binding protein
MTTPEHSRIWDFNRLAEVWEVRGLDRRQLMKLVGAGAGMTALATLATTPGAVAQAPDAVSLEWSKPRTLHPLFSTAGSEQQVERLIFGALVRMTATLEQEPDLAETVDVSDDATVYTFTLHENATFSDGTPLTSADVVFTIERALDTRTGSIWKGRLINIVGAPEFADQKAKTVTGVEAPDEHTVVITLATPDAAFLPVLADYTGLGILPKHILEKQAPENMFDDPFSLAPNVGAGPYKFVTYETDQYVELAANETFWGEAPAVPKIFMRILLPESAVAELEAGNVDLINVSLDDMERLAQNPEIELVSIDSPSMDSISFNLDKEYFQNKQLRQALQYAIDRENITAQIYKGKAIVRNSPIFGPDWMGVPEGLNEYPYDPEQAKSLLAESGWDTNQQVELMFASNSPAIFQSMVAIIQQQWADIGFKVNLLQVDATELNRKLVTDAEYEMYIGGGGVYGAEPSISAKYYVSTGFTPNGANSVHYANPKIDELYAKGRAVSDQAERKATYTEIAKILNDELPSIFLWSPNTNFAVNKRLVGFEAPSYVNNRVWNAEDWSIGS